MLLDPSGKLMEMDTLLPYFQILPLRPKSIYPENQRFAFYSTP